MGLLADQRLASIADLTSLGISTHKISDNVPHFGQFSGSNSENDEIQNVNIPWNMLNKKAKRTVLGIVNTIASYFEYLLSRIQ